MNSNNFSSLAAFLDQVPTCETSSDGEEIFLYHGTNCYRRLEMRIDGEICPGRSGLVFFSSRIKDAHVYAHSSSLRDRFPKCNSLFVEPVVLKVSFRKGEWPAVDFVQEESNGHFMVALAEGVPSDAIVDVIYCHHSCQANEVENTIRSFEDGTLLAGIRRLRTECELHQKEMQTVRLALKAGQKANYALTGRHELEVTAQDEIRKLKYVQSKFWGRFD